MKFKTVREGEQAIVYSYLGEGKLVVGPKRLFLFRSTINYLRRYTASPTEYLVIRDSQGLTVHKPGPCEMFRNPLEHESIEVAPAVCIAKHYVAIVYKSTDEGLYERRMVEGPKVFIPSANEWLHKFSWHGPAGGKKKAKLPETIQVHRLQQSNMMVSPPGKDDDDSKSSPTRMIPDMNTFSLLPIMPGHFHHSVMEVRTSDDILLAVDILLFYELSDPIKMLDETQDPIGDMINSITADIIQFCSQLKYSEFVTASSQLNSADSFRELAATCKRIGYSVNKVVYRGYHVSERLQSMNEKSIENQTQLRLNQEVLDMEQKLRDFRLHEQHRRMSNTNEVSALKSAHRQEVEAAERAHQGGLAALEHATEERLAAAKAATATEVERLSKEESLEFYRKLKDLGADIGSVLIKGQTTPVSTQIRLT